MNKPNITKNYTSSINPSTLSKENTKTIAKRITWQQFILLIGGSLFLGFLAYFLFYGKFGFGLNMLVFCTSFLLIFGRLYQSFKKSLNYHFIWGIPTILFFGSTFIFRSDFILNFTTFITLIFLVFFLVFTSTKTFKQKILIDTFCFSWLDFLVAPFVVLFSNIAESFTYIFSLLGFFKDAKAFKGSFVYPDLFSKLLVGLALAIPFLFIFGILLSSADQNFGNLIIGFISSFGSVISFVLSPKILFIGFISGICFLLFFFLVAFVFEIKAKPVILPSNHAFKPENQPKNLKLQQSNLVEVTTFLSLINLLFLAFIAIQFSYLFGGLDNINLEGFTYAQYARRGFGELIFVALLSLPTILVLDKVATKKDNGANFIFIKYLLWLFCFSLGVVAVSAIVRIFSYDKAYGMIFLRFYSLSFSFFLALIFVFTAIKIGIIKLGKIYNFSLFLLTLVYLASLNLINPAGFIIARNIDRVAPSQNQAGQTFYSDDLDYDAIAQTFMRSNDAVFEVKKILASDKHSLENKCKIISEFSRLNSSHEEYYKNIYYKQNVLNYNFSRRAILSYLEESKKIDCPKI